MKTGRAPAFQAELLPARAFADYVAMVERLSSGYFRPLHRRQPVPKRSL